MKRKYILPIIFMAALCTSCTNKNETKINVKIIEPSSEGLKFFCYNTPFYQDSGAVPYQHNPNFNTDEAWENIKDCGFNYALPLYDTNDEQIISTLEHAAKVGIKVYICDSSNKGLPYIIKSCSKQSIEFARAQIEKVSDSLVERYQRFAQYESFAGLNVYDEQSMDLYNALAAGQEWWYDHFFGYAYYTNLLPSYASYVQLFGSTTDMSLKYYDYVDRFVQMTNPEFISYDNYPFLRSGMSATIRSNYISDLETFALASRRYRIPFYDYQLCAGHWNYTAPESYKEYAWQVYSSLAYGCRGFQVFKYWAWLVPDVNPDGCKPGLTDQEGNLQPIYYAVQEVTKELKDFEHYYMGFTWEKTMATGGSGEGSFSLLTENASKLDNISSVDATGDALIGQFKDKYNNKAYVVMNYTNPYLDKSNQITLNFEGYNKIMVCKKGVKVIEPLGSDHKLTLNLGSGEGFFVIPVE